jgi:hypothetical protein
MSEHRHCRDITPPRTSTPTRPFYSSEQSNIAHRQIDFDSPTGGRCSGGLGSANAAAAMAAATTAKEQLDLHGPNSFQHPPNNLDLTSSCYEYQVGHQRKVKQYLPSDGSDGGFGMTSVGDGELYGR